MIKPLYPIVVAGIVLPFCVQAADNRQTDKKDDTLIVSAGKQSERSASVQNVSRTVVTESELDDAGVRSTKALTRVVPGLHMENNGSLLFPAISLRGISSAQDFYNPAVSFYVDGVPQLSASAIQTLTDVEAVEILRGPQGTLYGKSAQGGVINIVTRQPDALTRSWVEGGMASRGGYRGQGTLSGPVQDGLLYGSVTLLRQVDAGPFTNPATGSSHLGGSEASVGNLRLRLAPDEQPWATSLTINEECTRATQDAYVPFDEVHSRTLKIEPGLPNPSLRRCTHSQSLIGSFDTADWRFSAMGALQQQHYSREFPYNTVIVTMPERWNQDIQELRAATKGDSHQTDMLFGLYRQAVRTKTHSSMQQGNLSLYPQHARISSETLAAYSDLTWHVMPEFDLGTGLRFSQDKATADYHGNAFSGPYQDSGNTRDNQLLGQLSAGWQLTPDWRIYTRAAQGYKPAGFNASARAATTAVPFKAEKSMNYEIGSRYQAGPVQLQGALYHTDTRDIQIYSGTMGGLTLSNAGNASATGAELSAIWQFTQGWSFAAHGNYTEASFDNDSRTYADKKVPFVPRSVIGTSLTGTLDSPYGSFIPYVGLKLVGPYYFDGANQLRQGSWMTTDMRLGWQATERIHVAGYVSNLFDRRYRTYALVSPGSSMAVAQVNEGRTLGIDVRVVMF